MFDSPTIKAEVEVAQAFAAFAEAVRSAAVAMQELFGAFAEWVTEFAIESKALVESWWQQYRPLFVVLVFYKNYIANREAAERRRKRGIKSSMVRLW